MAQNIYRRGSTYWWRAMIAGKQHRRSTGQKDLVAAKKVAREFDRTTRAGGGVVMPTFGQWVLRYFEGAAATRKGATERDPSLLKPAVALWKDRPLDAIKRSDCEILLSRLRAGKGAVGTAWLRCVRTKLMFRLAIDEGLLTTNPWRGVRVPKPEKRSRVLSVAEEATLRNTLPPEMGRLLTVAIGTGLRRNELLNITPAHRLEGALRIPACLTKSGRARVVPLRPEVEAALDAQSPATTDAKYWPLAEGTATTVLREMSKAAGWPALTLHDLRRTFGTRCAEAGMPLSHLQAIMGHSNPAITAGYYVFIGENSARESLLKLNL